MRVDYDASIDTGGVTIGIKRNESGKYGTFWQEADTAPEAMGEYDSASLSEPTSPLTVLPNGKRPPEGAKAWIHGDRVAVIAPADWKALLGRLGLV